MRHVLVVANQTAVGAHLTTRVYELHEEHPELEVYVVVPATPRPLLEGGRDDGSHDAAARLAAATTLFQRIGVVSDGEVGVRDPMAAVQRAIDGRSFDLILVSTLPVAVSRWLKMDLPHRLSRRFDVPVEHLIGQHPDDEFIDLDRPGSEVRVLVVEDNEPDIELVKEALAEARAEVFVAVAANGEEALEYLRAHGQSGVDVVLLDLKMPLVDGHEFLEKVAEEFDIDALNVTVVSSSRAVADRERAHALGAGAYISKDPDFDVFAASLASVVDEVGSAAPSSSSST